MRARVLAAVALALSFVLVAAPSEAAPKSNGVATLSPAKALAKADKAMRKLTDVKYTATGRAALLTDVPAKQTISLILTKAGACDLTLKSGKASARTVVVGTKSYAKLSRAFYRAEGADADLASYMAGKWVRGKATKADRNDCKPSSFLPPKSTFKSFSKGKLAKVKGKQARVFTGTVNGSAVTIWVATKGQPVVLRMKVVDSASGDYLTYTLKSSNKGTKVKAPKGSKTISQWLA